MSRKILTPLIEIEELTRTRMLKQFKSKLQKLLTQKSICAPMTSTMGVNCAQLPREEVHPRAMALVKIPYSWVKAPACGENFRR